MRGFFPLTRSILFHLPFSVNNAPLNIIHEPKFAVNLLIDCKKTHSEILFHLLQLQSKSKGIVCFVGIQFLIDLFDEIRFVFDEMLTSRFQPNQCWFYSHKKLLEIDERIFQIKMTDGIFSKMSYHKQWNTINFERAREGERNVSNSFHWLRDESGHFTHFIAIHTNKKKHQLIPPVWNEVYWKR